MTQTIPATAAGRFYPSDADHLRRNIDAYLQATSTECHPKAIIVPHAAYGYSGSIAGSAYRAVQSVSDRVQRVLLLGTCHVRGVRGLATTSALAMATPLGEIPVDRVAVDEALSNLVGKVAVNDVAHTLDHSLQTQLPFLQVVLDSFSVAPFLVGTTNAIHVADFVATLSQPTDSLVVVSSDLSHYLDYDTCKRVDRHTAQAIVALDAESIGPEQACGFLAIRGLIHTARTLSWTARLLTLQNSGDTSGDQSRVVGYGAFALESP